MLGSSAGLIIAALIGIAVIVCLIVFAKVHAFLALMLGSFVMAILAGVPLTDSFTSFTTGLGSTVGNVGVLIVLGSMIGVLLTKTGASDQIVIRSLPIRLKRRFRGPSLQWRSSWVSPCFSRLASF